MKSKSLGTVFSRAFIIASVVTGILLAFCVALVSAYVNRRDNDERLATEIEYLKRQ